MNYPNEPIREHKDGMEDRLKKASIEKLEKKYLGEESD